MNGLKFINRNCKIIIAQYYQVGILAFRDFTEFPTVAIRLREIGRSVPRIEAPEAVLVREKAELKSVWCHYQAPPGSSWRHPCTSCSTTSSLLRPSVSTALAGRGTPGSCGIQQTHRKHLETPAAQFVGRPRWLLQCGPGRT